MKEEKKNKEDNKIENPQQSSENDAENKEKKKGEEASNHNEDNVEKVDTIQDPEDDGDIGEIIFIVDDEGEDDEDITGNDDDVERDKPSQEKQEKSKTNSDSNVEKKTNRSNSATIEKEETIEMTVTFDQQEQKQNKNENNSTNKGEKTKAADKSTSQQQATDYEKEDTQGESHVLVASGTGKFSLWGSVALGVGLFVAIMLTGSDIVKNMMLWISMATMALGFFTYDDWSKKLTAPFLPFFGMMTVCGVSTLYALAKKFALNEFLSVFLGFCVFMLLLMIVEKAESIACTVVVATSIISFLSIDLLSTRVFYKLFVFCIDPITSVYSSLSGVETGTRMTSLIVNPNVFGGCAGIAVILSLGLTLWETRKKEKQFYFGCLMLNSLAFVLTFSMGATGFIAVAFLAMLVLEQKEKRTELFIIMVETFVFALLSAFPIFFTAFTAWDGFNIVPLLCLVISVVGINLCHAKFGVKAIAYFEPREKEMKLFVGAVVTGIVVYGFLGFVITTGYTFENTSLRRALYPSAGEYTITSVASGDIEVQIITQNREDTMMHTNTTLYKGALSEATFEVPEDSTVVYFTFSASEGTKLESATLSDGSEIPLRYPLLPGFITNRFQGLFANQNAIQRTVFFEDGMKLFSRSPIWGLGMGSFENALFQVQSFYYETKYVHNHYIQMLLETGLVGFVCYTALGLGLLFALLKARKDKVPMVAMSISVLLFIFGHAFVEVVWSTSFYIPLAYGALAVIAVQLSDVCKSKKNPLGKKPVQIVFTGFMGLFMVLLIGNMHSKSIVERSTSDSFMNNLIVASQLDAYESQDYMVTYLVRAKESEDLQVHAQAEKFIEKLETISSNSIPYYIAEYYISQGNIPKATDALVNYVSYVISKSEFWNKAFYTLLMAMSFENYGEILEGLETLYVIMDQWNQDNLGNITLDSAIREEVVTRIPWVVED